jgi:hypothetical protein
MYVCWLCCGSTWPRGLQQWTVFARSNAGIVGSNPTPGMDVCLRLFCVCAVLCVGIGLATGWSPVRGVLQTVYMIKKLKKWSRSNKRAVEPYIYIYMLVCFLLSSTMLFELHRLCPFELRHCRKTNYRKCDQRGREAFRILLLNSLETKR